MGKMEKITHEIQSVLVELPIEPTLPEGYLSRRINIARLMPRQAKALRMLALGADKKGVCSKTGKRVTNGCEAIRYFLDQVAEQSNIT